MKRAGDGWNLLTLWLVLLGVAAPLHAEWNSADSPAPVSGDSPVGRGYIIPYVEPADGGAKLTVDIFHNSVNDPVTLVLQAVVNNGSGQVQTIVLQSLSDHLNDNPTSYLSRRVYTLNYDELNRKLRELAPGAPKLVVEPGTALFVGARFGSGHQWGGPQRAGVFYLPVPTGQSASVSKQISEPLPRTRTEALDIAQPIRQAMANVFNLDGGKRGLRVGGQLRSRVEGEGKFQLTKEQFESARRALYDLAKDPTKAQALLGAEWTLTRIDRYLQKDSAGVVKTDGDGFPVPDPMVDTYYDNKNLDAARHDMAIRYRWTEGNRAGAWNFKPGMGEGSPEGIVYRVEYGIDTTDNKPESIAKFADSMHPLNPFRYIRQAIPGSTPSEFLLPAVQLTDFRHKFLLKHQSGLAIEVSLDDVRAQSLRAGSDAPVGNYFQLEMDIDHLAVQSNNTSAVNSVNGVLGAGTYGAANEALKQYLAGIGKDAFFDGRPTLHVIEDVRGDSPVRTKRLADFVLASQVIGKVRQSALGDKWISGAQKYAIAAFVAGLVSPEQASPSTRQVLAELKRHQVDPAKAGCVAGLALLGKK